jgi:mannose-1-phosphate guanylyltransferase
VLSQVTKKKIYGNIRIPKIKINGISYFSVLRFHEKPNLAGAKRFLKQGNFFWNGGTFVWRLDAFKAAVRKYAPDIYRAWDPLKARGNLRRIYRKLPSISIDYAVMEKMKNVHCLLAPFEWSDLGGWQGISKFWPKDKQGNRVGGTPSKSAGLDGYCPTRHFWKGYHGCLFIRSHGNIVRASNRLVALLGVQDLLIVDTPDALLIAPRSRTEEIREVVKELEKRKEWKYL